MRKISLLFTLWFAVNVFAEWECLNVHGLEIFVNKTPNAKLHSVGIHNVQADLFYISFQVSTQKASDISSLVDFLTDRNFLAGLNISQIEIKIPREEKEKVYALVDALNEFEPIEPRSIIAEMKTKLAHAQSAALSNLRDSNYGQSSLEKTILVQKGFISDLLEEQRQAPAILMKILNL